MYATDALGLLTILPSDSNEQSMAAGTVNGPSPTFTYQWFPHPEIPMTLRTLQRDLTYVMTDLHSHPYEDQIPRPGVLIRISGSSDLWAIEGPFTYEVAAWYARAMLMYFEQPGHPHCALLLSISRNGGEIGRAEVRPRYSAGQDGMNVTASETADTVTAAKKY